MSPDILSHRTPPTSPQPEGNPSLLVGEDLTSKGLPRRVSQRTNEDIAETDIGMHYARIQNNIATAVGVGQNTPLHDLRSVVSEASLNNDIATLAAISFREVPEPLRAPLDAYYQSGAEDRVTEGAVEIMDWLGQIAHREAHAKLVANAPRGIKITFSGHSNAAPTPRPAERKDDKAEADAARAAAWISKLTLARQAAEDAPPVIIPAVTEAVNVLADSDTPTVEIKGRLIATAGEPRHRKGPQHLAGRGRKSYSETRPARQTPAGREEPAQTAPVNRDASVRSHRKSPSIGTRLHNLNIGTRLHNLKNRLLS
ncbi:MAG TPA: hypothetical protein VLI54_02420 [Bacillota bacterium]|nr:hypothetical protein [Bacillota bacterium]